MCHLTKRLLLLFLTGLQFLFTITALPSVPVLKCCPNGQVLDLNTYTCVVQVAVDVFVVIKGLNVNSPDPRNNLVQIKLEKKGEGMPNCQVKEHHIIKTERPSSNWLTTTGELATSKYEAEFDHGQFCLDRSLQGDRTNIVALMCDPCKIKACINLCCPHGYAKQPDPSLPEGSPLACLPHSDSHGWNPKFWDPSTKQLVDLERHTDYVVVGAVGRPEGFTCPMFDGKKVDASPADFHYDETKLDKEGQLVGTLFDQEKNVTETTKLQQNQFCFAFAKFPDYDYDDAEGSGQYPPENYTDSEEEVVINPLGPIIQLTTVQPDEYDSGPTSSLSTLFAVCENQKALTKEENFINVFYPAALLISAFFILLTCIVYILLSELHGNLFGKITIGFLINLFISYIVLAYSYIKAHNRTPIEQESAGCYFIAYLTLYTFTAFFFWLSAMGFNIARKFSNIMRMSGSDPKRDKISLILITIYAQGSPLILCIFTYIMDYTKPAGAVLPNMGLNCFLGSEPSGTWEPYTSSPEFLYFHLIVILLQIFNLSCFVLTAYFLVSHWKTAKNLNKNASEDQLTNFLVLLKLFILMGIPWIAELISGVIEHGAKYQAMVEESDQSKNITVTIILDLVNLFAGVLIFLILVCKKTVWNSLKKKLSGRNNTHNSSHNNSRKNTTMSSSSVASAIYVEDSAM